VKRLAPFVGNPGRTGSLAHEEPGNNQRKDQRGIEQLDRGEGIPEDQLDAHLGNLKSRT
jgi:hypothetical protein